MPNLRPSGKIMANLSDPEDILAEFLSANVTEYTRYDSDGYDKLPNRTIESTETFSGDDSETEFSISTPNLVAIKEITIGGTKVYKYIDYDIDLDNAKITFDSAPTTGSNNISVTYFEGNNWIYTDKPIDTLSRKSYPRVAIQLINQSERQRGVNDDYYYKNYTFQIDALTYKDQLLEISSEKKANNEAVKVIAGDIVTQIKTKWRSELRTKLFNFNIINNSPVPFSENSNQFRRIIEISCDGEDS